MSNRVEILSLFDNGRINTGVVSLSEGDEHLAHGGFGFTKFAVVVSIQESRTLFI